MKTFEIPASDCGCFVGGYLSGDVIADMAENGAPEHGIVIWYKDKETMLAAMKAVQEAHWPTPQ
jgi:hypothetical protein